MTTATGSAEEVQFLKGMEREPSKEDWREVTVTLDSAGKKAWRIDGMLHRLLEMAGHALGKVRSLADRGPVDFDEMADERRLLMRIIKDQARNSGGGPGSVNTSSKLGWLVTLNIAITVAVSGWIVSNIIEQGKQIAVIECRLNPQCASVVPRGQ